jgi:hypothetical protein
MKAKTAGTRCLKKGERKRIAGELDRSAETWQATHQAQQAQESVCVCVCVWKALTVQTASGPTARPLQPCLRGDIQRVSLRPMAWTRDFVSAETCMQCRCRSNSCELVAQSGLGSLSALAEVEV